MAGRRRNDGMLTEQQVSALCGGGAVGLALATVARAVSDLHADAPECERASAFVWLLEVGRVWYDLAGGGDLDDLAAMIAAVLRGRRPLSLGRGRY